MERMTWGTQQRETNPHPHHPGSNNLAPAANARDYYSNVSALPHVQPLHLDAKLLVTPHVRAPLHAVGHACGLSSEISAVLIRARGMMVRP